jgi:UDP-glucose 4-epimerase
VSKAVLVTGAKGFIGRETVKQLERQGWQVLPAMRCPEGKNDVQLDLEDPGFPLKLLSLPRVDAIVHLAARVEFAGIVADMYIQNVAATASLLALAKRWNASFVFASTALIAGSDMVEMGPQMKANPNAPYIQSKWLAERLVEASGVRSTILRIGGVFGLDGPGHLGLNRAIGAVVAGSRRCPGARASERRSSAARVPTGSRAPAGPT